MKIAVPVDEDSLETNVCVSFGRCPYFFFYDDDKKETKFLENPAAHSTGGAGIKAAQVLVDEKADVLLTIRCGENAGEVMQPAGIKVYKTIAGSARENVDFYLEGKLSLLDKFHAGFHGVGA